MLPCRGEEVSVVEQALGIGGEIVPDRREHRLLGMRIARHWHILVHFGKIQKLPRERPRGTLKLCEIVLHVEAHRDGDLVVPTSTCVYLLPCLAYLLDEVVLDDRVTILVFRRYFDFSCTHVFLKRVETAGKLLLFFGSEYPYFLETLRVRTARCDIER